MISGAECHEVRLYKPGFCFNTCLLACLYLFANIFGLREDFILVLVSFTSNYHYASTEVNVSGISMNVVAHCHIGCLICYCIMSGRNL